MEPYPVDGARYHRNCMDLATPRRLEKGPRRLVCFRDVRVLGRVVHRGARNRKIKADLLPDRLAIANPSFDVSRG